MSDASPRACCDEFAAVSRRGLMRGALAMAGTTTILGSAVVRASAAAPTPARSVMVVVSMRGAADGLSLVVPHAERAYYDARPRLAIPSDRLLVKDGQFGLHPELAPLVPMWLQGKLAAVHATGLAAPNRSHFAAMEEIEDAAPGSSKREGWLNRLIGTHPTGNPLQGFSYSLGGLPTSLAGPQPVMSGGDLDRVAIPGEDKYDSGGRRRSLKAMWDKNPTALGRAMRTTFAAVDDFGPVREGDETPRNAAMYPDCELGRALAAVARIIRGDVGVEVLTVDQGDWDHHSDLGTVDWGRMKRNAGEFAAAVAAFYRDLGLLGDKVTLVSVSEFGRRVRENANYGLDHGYGNVMFVAGAGVNGGRYYARWPGLSTDHDADLMVTTDYRNVLAEIAQSRFGASSSAVFPGLVREQVGVMKGI